jgi:ABC-type nitrate/sulfonate/bicarbonate transport system substrate-binding protein
VTRRTVLRTTAGLCALVFPSVARVARLSAGTPPTVRIVAALRSLTQGIGRIGTEAGMFQRLGVDVHFPRLKTGGPEAAAGLVRGDWEFAEVGVAPIVQGVLDGKDPVVLLQAQAATRGGALLVRQGITEPAQLHGGRIGVLTETGQMTLSAQAALRQLGLSATLVPLGTFAKIVAAVAAGEVDAGTVGIEYRLAARQQFGLDTLLVPGGLSLSVLATTRRLIAADRALVTRVIEGYVRTLHLLKTNRMAAIPLVERFLGDFDQRTVEAIYEYFMPRFQPLPRPEASGIQVILDELAAKSPAARTLAPETCVDASFVNELEHNGFVTRLYAG